MRSLLVLPILAALGTAAAAQTYATGETPYDAFPHHVPPAFQPGAYEVKATVELPNIQDIDVAVTRKLCLVAEGGTGKYGFAVLSENNPLAHCPMVNVQERGNEVTFDIKCTGSNSAKASATYLLLGDSFRGRIDMTMGGKNMTMSEVQEGHRVGACQPPS